jgi:hypothetical protein
MKLFNIPAKKLPKFLKFGQQSFNSTVSIPSVTAGTDKAVKKAEREAKKALTDAAVAAEKSVKAQQRAIAKAEKAAQIAEAKLAKAAARQAAKDQKAADKAAEEAKATAIAIAVNSVLLKGDAIAQKFEASEGRKVDFKNSSRKVTYDLLVEVLAYVEELDKRADLTDVLDTMRGELRQKWKIKTQENTSDLGVIVKYITRAKRKNAHMYARVLEEARKHKANSGNLLIYIEQRGGINKIVAGNKANNLSEKQRLHNAYKRYAQAVLVHDHRDGGMGKIPLTPTQVNKHYDSRDNAHFVYTFGKVQNGELVVIDFVPWVNQTQEEEFLLFHTLNTIKVPGNSSCLDKAMSDILHKKMAVMFDKYNASRLKNDLSAINQFGEVTSGSQLSDFSVFNWAQFDADYAEYLAAKEQPQQS